MKCSVAALLFVAFAAVPSQAVALRRAPSDVGDGKGGKHPCVQVMQETVRACDGKAYGTSDDDCNFAVCYTAHLNRDRCAGVVTKGTPKNVEFDAQLDKLATFHAIECEGGEQHGSGIRNARFDCGSVDSDGLWNPSALLQFAKSYPVSAETSGLKSCLLAKHGNAAQVTPPTKALVVANTTLKTATLSEMELGPFGSEVEACSYCFGSHTRSLVVEHCTCTAYSDGGNAKMFCTGTGAGIKYVGDKGGCKCTEKNMEQQGATTCDPF